MVSFSTFVKVSFPKDYQAKNVAGKDAVFEVKINEIKEDVEIVINDDFAKTLGMNDLNALKKIDQIIQKNSVLKDLKVIYRPHPVQQKRSSKNNFYNETFKNIILDKDAKKFYKKKFTQSFVTPLNYYPSLIKNSEFVIAPLTTLLIESLIFFKKILVLLHNDDFHYETPRRTFESMEHLKILRNREFLNYSYNFDDLEKALVNSYMTRNIKNKKKISNFLNKVIKNPKKFDKNIYNLVNKF